jgi:hypothetical protein
VLIGDPILERTSQSMKQLWLKKKFWKVQIGFVFLA